LPIDRHLPYSLPSYKPTKYNSLTIHQHLAGILNNSFIEKMDGTDARIAIAGASTDLKPSHAGASDPEQSHGNPCGMGKL